MVNEIPVTTTYITKTQAAAYLQVSEKTIERYSYATEAERRRIEASGKQPLRRYRFNGRSLYKLADIHALLENIPNAETDQAGDAGGILGHDTLAVQSQPRSSAQSGKVAFPTRGVRKVKTPQLSMDFGAGEDR